MQYTLSIEKYRKLRGMTQMELAKKVNMNQSYLSHLEKNTPKTKSPTLRMIFKIANALDVCPHVLINYEKNCFMDCVTNCPKS